jgi:hypothetical protein
MTSDDEPNHRRPGRTLVYLDANVLAAGISRTLLLLSAPLSNFRTVWSRVAEAEAARHQPPHAKPIGTVREQYGLQTVPDGESPVPLVDTDWKDRRILASAAAAGARFVVTENVKDFGVADLRALSMSAVHPDLFLASRLTERTYRFVLDAIAANRSREPATPAAIHASEVAKKMPMLFDAYKQVLGVEVVEQVAGQPKLTFRGARCVRCVRPLTDAESRAIGLGPGCRRTGPVDP